MKTYNRPTAPFDPPRLVRIWRALTRLRSVASFLNTGAHPDDETSGMLAALALGQGVRTGVLCANRGEGGQNAIGREGGADLGTIRTAEMEQAALVLDTSLYWLSTSPDDTIFDFRFSKSAEETLERWGHARVLSRIVRIYRQFKPDIVCPTFLDVPGQHGHHRAMTRAAFEAIELAADPNAFPEHSGIWQVQKFYLPAWSGAGDSYDDDEPPPQATTSINTDLPDPATGDWYQEIGQISRGYHATQGMGRAVEGGPMSWPLHLAWSYANPKNAEESVLSGLALTLADIDPSLAPAQALIDELSANFASGERMITLAQEAVLALDQAKVSPIDQHRIDRKRLELRQLIIEAARIRPQAIAHKSRLAPGESTQITLPEGSNLIAPAGWQTGIDRIKVPLDAAFTDPYPDQFDPLHRRGLVGCEVAGIEFDLMQPITVLPASPVTLSPDKIVINRQAPPAALDIVAPQEVHISLPNGWQLQKGQLLPPRELETGNWTLAARQNSSSAHVARWFGYTHINPCFRVVPASIELCVMDVALPENTRIAYAGSGHDRVLERLCAIGLDITSLDHVNAESLAPFTTLLVGIHAFGSRRDLQPDLLREWVASGGHLVTLYHLPKDGWNANSTPPLPLEIGSPSLRWRVTNENAHVQHLEPEHPLLCTPNPIGPADWQGWVKERGLYFAKSWHPAYRPLLSMADPGERALTGSLLSAAIGKGRHTHISLVLHIQLEALVPGAYRLMANLVQRN